ncbi:hypothetical protein BDZ91DRAFT_454727 [Kalaharituber pfeilii]|nr:hypothetical protein BDZ91DRAFT_454727 [Kalaharituber pfeilii]
MAKRLTVRLQRNWASYTQSHEFPWTWRLVEKELSSQELEDTERVYLEIHFKHKTYNQDDPCQYVVIKQLCDTLLDPSEALNLASIDNSDAVSFIPTSRGFFTRNPTKWFRGPLHAIVFVTDVLIWFKPHIEKLEAMFRGRFSRARDEERAAILFDYMRIAAPMSASIKGWAVCRLEELKPENVEQQIDQALRPFRQAALDSLTTLQHLNGSYYAVPSCSDPERKFQLLTYGYAHPPSTEHNFHC